MGRYKTRYVAEVIRQQNPNANVHTYECRICRENEELLRGVIRQVELVISAVDDHRAIVLLNKICVDENKPLIIAGAFRRAYGGQVLVVRPKISPCYECFRRGLPEKALDHEISSAEQAQQIAYSDRPVPVEPGLSSDILPISTMVVKLALMVLLKTRPTTLRSLEEDLVAPWFLWLNRREIETEYEKLLPLGCHQNGMHILRWYGINLRRRPDCPCCGDFVGAACTEAGIQIGEQDVREFAG
jgi:molybdopterin/thiamine biosynthesis adenylyltransferase